MDGCYACGGLRRLVLYSPSTFMGPVSTCAKNGTHFQGGSMQVKYQIITLKIAARACSSHCYSPSENFNGTMQLAMDEESCEFVRPHLIARPDKTPEVEIEEYLLEDLDDGLQGKTERPTNSAKVTSEISDREIQRRQKIGLANKGRTPWNKGKQHTQETRDRIKKRTIEALSDPKVRKKMSGYPRPHSDLSRERIGASLRRIWAERLKHKRAQENCYLIWARCISEAAKEGGLDQQELSWDSYENLKADLMVQYLEQQSEKAWAKEIKRLRAEEKAKVRAEKHERLAQRRKEKEEMKDSRKTEALARKKLKDEKAALSRSLRLKARLTKFHPRRKKLEGSDEIHCEEAIKCQTVNGNWDIERIKIEKKQSRVSLADQIQALKNKKAEFAAEKTSDSC